MAGEIDSELRQEIMECQKARTEFIRWKMLIVAVLGSASLGIVKDAPPAPYLLAFVPFVCIYVDSVCLHNDSRIMMIASFLRTSREVSQESHDYEKFCNQRRDMFYNEGLAIFGSTLFLCASVIFLGEWRHAHDAMAMRIVWLLRVSGSIGAVVTVWLVHVNRQIQRGRPPLQIFAAAAKRDA
jgi:hypothetical protein